MATAHMQMQLAYIEKSKENTILREALQQALELIEAYADEMNQYRAQNRNEMKAVPSIFGTIDKAKKALGD